MKKITIVSGKGGTGKTIVTGALVATASLSRRIITVDCDVDAPDLHLILRPQVVKRFEFKGRAKVQIEADDCNRCGKCREVCRFEAINENFVIDQISCEGCLFCYHICPVGAVRTTDHRSGEYFISTTKYGPMVHAQLGVAEENSGRLVTVVRKEAEEIARAKRFDYIIADGPPGIGCPAIAAIGGVDLALVVTEPTITAIHDLKRVLTLIRHFGIRAAVVINKYDLDQKNGKEIEEFCERENIEVMSRIPFDPVFPRSIVEGRPAVELSTTNGIAEIFKSLWWLIEQRL